uniref:C2H2-type domain-containing protein n=1 Tax=Macrostomum lignano TaxID=282301 RepID=A0A1I8FNR6_9PLAT
VNGAVLGRAPLNLTSLLLHRRGLVRPKPGFLARFARQRPSDRDRRLLAGLAAAESSDPSSVYLSMLTCSFEFCRELFEPASGCDRLPQARWPVRGLCVVSDAYMRQLDSLMDESGRAFLMQQPYRRLLGMRFGRRRPAFRPVELVDVRAERRTVLTVEEPILQPEQQPSKPSPAAVDQLVKEQPDLVDTDYCGAAAAATADTALQQQQNCHTAPLLSAASDADAIVGTGGASVFGKLLAMLNVKASSATPEQWDEFDAGFDCFDNPDAAARLAASYDSMTRSSCWAAAAPANESEGASRLLAEELLASLKASTSALASTRRRGGTKDDNDDEDERATARKSAAPQLPAGPGRLPRLNELVLVWPAGQHLRPPVRRPSGCPAVAEPPPAAGCGAANLSREREGGGRGLAGAAAAARARGVDLFLLLGYAQFCDNRAGAPGARPAESGRPGPALPPTTEPLRPGLLDFDQLHERGLGCPDLLCCWRRLLPYDLTRCVAFVVLCCASVQPAAGGADDFNCGGGGSRRRRIKVAESDGILRELTAHVMAKHTKLLRCHLCDGVNLPAARSSTRSTGCGSTFTMYTQSNRTSAASGGHHFKRLYLLRNHMAAVHKEPLPASAVPASASKSVAAEVWDEISCEVCKKVFSSERLLAVHRQRVHGQTSESRCFPCPHCQASLKGKQNLVSHIKQIHESPRVTKECPVCQKQVRNLSDHVISQHK